MRSLTSLLVFLLACGLGRTQTVYHVDITAAPGGDGQSWLTAFRDLQDGLDAARADTDATQVWVAAGEYRPDRATGDRSLSFDLPDAIEVLGGFEGDEVSEFERDWEVYVVVLSGDLDGDDDGTASSRNDNSRHVVNNPGGVHGLLDGVTVRSGSSTDEGGGILTLGGDLTLRHCVLEDNHAVRDGGGLYGEEGILLLDDVQFRDNHSGGFGGGLSHRDGPTTVSGCVFSDNTAVGEGGGLYTRDADFLAEDCSFQDNQSEDRGGGASNATSAAAASRDLCYRRCHFVGNDVRLMGGGLYTFRADGFVRIEDCVFDGNHASEGGGWFSFGFDAGPGPLESIARRCSFLYNESLSVGVGVKPGHGGGAFGNDLDRFVLVDCRFVGNQALEGGAVEEASVEDFVVRRSTFIDNHAVHESGSGGGLMSQSASLQLLESLFAQNTAGDRGGALSCRPEALIQGCTIVGNVAGGDVGGLYSFQDRARVLDTVLWANLDQDGGDQEAQLRGVGSVDYCCVQGLDGSLGGAGNFGDDPLFIDETADWRLQSSSPCVDTGDPDLPILPDAERDLTGLPRLLDGDLDREMRVDVGAHEFGHVQLRITGDFLAGGTVTVTTSGTPGLPTLMIVGIDTAALTLNPFGILFVELGPLCRCFPWLSAPSDVELEVPSDFTGPLDLSAQLLVFAAKAGNLSNGVSMTFE